MGDKGGKKDKEKNKQQQLTKQKQEEQRSRTRCGQRLRSTRLTESSERQAVEGDDVTVAELRGEPIAHPDHNRIRGGDGPLRAEGDPAVLIDRPDQRQVLPTSSGAARRTRRPSRPRRASAPSRGSRRLHRRR